MREILFRGKRADNGEWIYGDLIQNVDCIKIREQEKDIKHISKSFEIIPETAGQFTGLTDKNGKKIWEGDIVKNHYANTKKSDFVETVVFHNGQFCAFYSNNNYKQWAMLYDGVEHLAIDKSVYMDSVEVIGNIHDNPELLKGGDEE